MQGPVQTTRVWDLPVRVFHWALVLLVVSQIVTVSIGGNAMEYHVLGGFRGRDLGCLICSKLVTGYQIYLGNTLEPR